MRIRFIGLITHMLEKTDPNKGFVVLPAATDHYPRLMVYEGDLDGNPDDPLGKRICYGLNGHTVFDHVEPLNRRRLAGVTKLNDVGGAGHTILNEVYAKTPTANLTAFVDLPGGEYGIEEWFEYRASFNNGVRRCMPFSVLLHTRATSTINVTGGLLDITTNPPTPVASLKLKPFATVTITNVEPDTIPLPAGDFLAYQKLFSAGATIHRPVVDTSQACDHGQNAHSIPRCNNVQQTATVECSNSQYP
jgi:hypothetical protein